MQVLFSFPYNIIFFLATSFLWWKLCGGPVYLIDRAGESDDVEWSKQWDVVEATNYRDASIFYHAITKVCIIHKFWRYETQIEWKMKMKAEIRNEHHHLLEVSKDLTHSLKFAINTQQFPLCCSSILKRLNLINHISSNGRRDYLVGFLA